MRPFVVKPSPPPSYFKSDWALILPHILARCIISLTKYFQVLRFYSRIFGIGQRWWLNSIQVELMVGWDATALFFISFAKNETCIGGFWKLKWCRQFVVSSHCILLHRKMGKYRNNLNITWTSSMILTESVKVPFSRKKIVFHLRHQISYCSD